MHQTQKGGVCPVAYDRGPFTPYNGEVPEREWSDNRLLSLLPSASRKTLVQSLRPLEVTVGQQLFAAEERHDVYFPLNGIVSLMRSLEDGSTVEVAVVGPEGMVGVNAVLGVHSNPHHAVVQGAGTLGYVARDSFQKFLQSHQGAREVLLRYVYTYNMTCEQLAVCNRLHLIEQRLAHWLLLMHDRLASDQISLTQEFLGSMLASRRASINAAIKNLTLAGCLRHSRGRVTILSRKKLEEASCPCYRQNVEEYARVFGFPPAAVGRAAV